MACIKPPVTHTVGKTAIIGVTQPVFASGPTAAPMSNTATARSHERSEHRQAPQQNKATPEVRAATERAERAATAAATMSLDQVTAAKKQAQRDLTSARKNRASAAEVARLQEAVKTLQRAESKKQSETAATSTERLLLPAPRPGSHLAHGTARHKTLQYEDNRWAESAGLEALAEAPVLKNDGSKGRIDHVVYLDGSHRDVVITEYKTDRFDRHSERQLTRRMDEIVRQIDSYRFAEDLAIETSQTVLHIDERPTTPGYAEFIEERCAEAGISVIFLRS